MVSIECHGWGIWSKEAIGYLMLTLCYCLSGEWSSISSTTVFVYYLCCMVWDEVT